jgi:NAD(P) transhydrogenase subunit alpha
MQQVSPGENMQAGIPREFATGERRVAATPETVEQLRSLGLEVLVEAGAGERAHLTDQQFSNAGAQIVDREAAWKADLVLHINPPTLEEVALIRPAAILISLIYPRQNEALVEALREQGVTTLALDCVPRISRAQSMDVLSSMAGIAGYRAVIEASSHFGRFMSQQYTAAGSTPPANVLVIGAGVAGLAAIATASSMGARVKGFDVREAAQDQIRSLGGEVLELDFDESGEGEGGYAKQMSDAFIEAEHALFEREANELDIVITTAMVPGKAPLLLTKQAVENMRPGSVVVDLAASSGGNCELTEPGEVVEHNGVIIVGHTDLTSRLPAHASQFYGRNVVNFLKLVMEGGEWEYDTDDPIQRGVLVTRDARLMWPPPPIEPPKSSKPEVELAADAELLESTEPPEPPEDTASSLPTRVAVGIAAAATLAIGIWAPADFVQRFTVFVLACFVGWQVVWNVNAALHTPLMSVTNAISGIVVLSGILLATQGSSVPVLALAAAAIFVASINIFGGFMVTHRMLQMFKGGDSE